MTEQEQHSDLKIYINCLQSAKTRLLLAQRIVSGDLKIGDEAADHEVACLQVRKCLELIAFASIAAHKETYARAQKDFQYQWRTTEILKKIRSLHPKFYPVPVTIENKDAKVKKLVRVTEGYLTEDDFVFLLDKLTDVVHEWNPYHPKERIVDFQRPMDEWLARIWRLFQLHMVHLAGTDDIWIVNFDGEDGNVHAFPAASKPGESTGRSLAIDG
jgi:hypothetical protein